MKHRIHLTCSILFVLFFNACTSDADSDIFYNQPGVLEWHGSPAVDGLGMIFETEDGTQFGAPGEPDDYPRFFTNDTTYSVSITANYRLTGELTARGWGVTFPEIEFLRINNY